MKAVRSSLHTCQMCELNFHCNEGMKKHNARVHGGKAVGLPRYKFEKCKSYYKTKQYLKQPIRLMAKRWALAICVSSNFNNI